MLTRLGLASSGLIKSLAREAGFTPLHYAVMKGDVDAVNILLQYNADLNVKNDLNYDVLEYVFISTSLSYSYSHTNNTDTVMRFQKLQH